MFWKGKKCKSPIRIQTNDLQIRNLCSTLLRYAVRLQFLERQLLIILDFIVYFVGKYVTVWKCSLPLDLYTQSLSHCRQFNFPPSLLFLVFLLFANFIIILNFHLQFACIFCQDKKKELSYDMICAIIQKYCKKAL